MESDSDDLGPAGFVATLGSLELQDGDRFGGSEHSDDSVLGLPGFVGMADDDMAGEGSDDRVDLEDELGRILESEEERPHVRPMALPAWLRPDPGLHTDILQSYTTPITRKRTTLGKVGAVFDVRCIFYSLNLHL